MRIFNSKTHRMEEFVPIKEGEVKIYNCGPTVYNYLHIGNARASLMFDAFRRYLKVKGYKVTYVQNITDIDDKMINRAIEEGITVKELADKFIAAFFEDADKLGIQRADVHPKATEHIDEIIDLIKRLEEKGLAYQSEDGVYFDTHAYEGYGAFIGQDLEDLESGARVDVDEKKKNPADFVLWKAWKPGEPYWESPWGKGRPGWHIECSAMSMKYLGETFDIHSGGQDLCFPHHENETAQSEGATGKTFVNYWMHNGFINVNNEKMSKSKGQAFYVRDILKQYRPESLRLFLLSSHYRSPINYSNDLLNQAKSALERLYNAKENYEFIEKAESNCEITPMQKEFMENIGDYRRRFDECMDDDFNTAGAIGVMFELVRDANALVISGANAAVARAAKDALMELADILGLLSGQEGEEIAPEIMELVEKRRQARADKNWAEADAVRDSLKELGYAVEDTPQGAKVKKL